ncbi:Flavodoxin reductase (ferredoxin-NADPH reductase) family 1, Vanillate O-demethylase oxidoreductase [Roseibacterium elongatum DSM 19469]|uniref:Flavodoxin reductase (Ferredoxin-NADPH reductase) family 1, Vanillate O-demethylase oxidoreductase n=1 Tax=Roseicyclus elongatus DSM 19469 TaxID=1294273 RepID=W8RXA8_9RHOB|nr:2Fe-2S iron-sulfur cluster-binding protein [Roseibacterium elongatum]AHM05849.1 Flavodoxin reductase (ferredoxin-NADPH reductase) family 1, Vanillate O-demethylase oxidoreductase [Roseibacterium elongatum DSM 19469]
MGLRFFSNRNRPVHLGPYPTERLRRLVAVDLSQVPTMCGLPFDCPERPEALVNAMAGHQAMLDAIRDGFVNKARATIPDDPAARADHIKAFGYFNDAAMVGICRLPDSAQLPEPIANPAIDRLARDLRRRQTKTLASGIDVIMADLKESMEAPASGIGGHSHAIVFLYQAPRPPRRDEPGTEWLAGAERHSAAMRANETACVIATYIRLLGWDAKSHSATASDVCLNRLAVAAGLTTVEDGELSAPWIGAGFGLAAVTTTLDLQVDAPLAPWAQQPWAETRGPAWWLGTRAARSALTRDPFARRGFVQGAHPFERLRRVDAPTTHIDEARVPRVPKRTDMFARAQFGDMGKTVQDGAKGGHYARKSAPSSAQRRALGAFVLLQDGAPNPAGARPTDAVRNAQNLKAASHFLGVDAVGLSRCPDWTWYSHDATGAPIDPAHDQAISMIIDQGYETMEGASGDDWISVAQSMRAYLRFSLLGGVIAQQIRNLGYSAKAHTVMDGEVLQPPLLLLSGLGEVSRIGEVILNPYLGPRLKSGVVTTDMPIAHDAPIDFGLQAFCEACNKCARECPSGAITAGPKLMFNGYEIWKSDSQKCATYRITTEGGAMCGRCMKTCPWNLEGLFAEAPFRWAASNIPALARPLAKLDDALGRGGLNDTKKWWWDIELQEDGAYRPTRHPVNRRGLQRDLDLRPEDQTMAVYPANLAPWPWPYPFPMDREAGIAAFQALVTAEEYKLKLSRGETDHLHAYHVPGDAPVLRVEVARTEQMTEDITKYEFRALDGGDLPEWTAGAHLDIVVAPEFLRQYSMSGDPADRTRYEIGVLREEAGRGGSKLMHRIFTEGRKVFISKPINHFDLVEDAEKTLLMAGGIGVTPMIAFAHRLHTLGRDFALHYSVPSRDRAAYLADLAAMPWADRVHLHISDEGTRADLEAILRGYRPGWHVYTCGPDRYMDSVIAAAETAGFPDEARHLEYFSVPEVPEYENHPFTLRLSDGREFAVPPEKSATDVLAENGVQVDVKCSDGICGVCKCRLISGAVEHRDWVLSKAQRRDTIILCQSRAVEPNSVIEVEL